MSLARWLVVGSVAVVVGCQAPAPVTPTPRPTAPTPAVSAPTPAVSAPTRAPTALPSPTAVPPPTSASRIDTLNAANAAFQQGERKAAAGLYERVVNTPPMPTETAATSAAIDDFARFRGLVTLLADGREDDARVDLDELQKRDPNAPFARLASQLYDQYGMTGQLRGACAQLQPLVASQAGPTLALLQGLGVAVDPQSLCRVP